MNDDYQQGRLDALAAVHRLLAELGCEFMVMPPREDKTAQRERFLKMDALTQVSRRVMALSKRVGALSEGAL